MTARSGTSMARSADPPDAERTIGGWVWPNVLRLTLYLAVASLVSAGGMLVSDGAFTGPDQVDDALAALAVIGGYMFVLGGLGCVPGLAVWLAVLQPIRAWSPVRRRLMAVVTAPLVGVVWLVLFVLGDAYAFAFVFGVFWPLGAGLVVRFDPSDRRPHG